MFGRFVDGCKQVARSVVRGAKRAVQALACAVAPAAVGAGAVFAGLPVWAQETVTLPSTGVNVPGHITALVTALGTIAAAALAAWAAFFVIRKGLRWVRSVG